ncbi:MAG TPA: hypothetical protein VHL79_22680 [Ramlibacter sp.]|jgi:hypothetical protein|nr:hypothetical protein [Ramlibacter sp.]
MVPNNTTLQDWLRAHDALVEAERNFAVLTTEFAAGRVSQQDLDAAWHLLRAQRALCDAVFQKAVQNFGNAP